MGFLRIFLCLVLDLVKGGVLDQDDPLVPVTDVDQGGLGGTNRNRQPERWAVPRCEKRQSYHRRADEARVY